MSDYVVHGDELKKIVRLGRRRPMPFAFCPSVGEDESLFATHRKKPPELIARVTRKESGQTKVAYGTFVILGKLMVLTCIKELPAIAKKLKKHMRAERLPLNIRVMDMSGREIEVDIDTLDDGEDPFGDDDDDDEDDDTVDGFVRWNAAGAGQTSRRDRLGERIEGLKPAILAAGGDRGDRLRDLLSAVIEAKEGGRRDRAESLITRLEKEVSALMGSSSRPQVAMPGAPPRTGKKPEVAKDTSSDADEEEDDDDDEEATPKAKETSNAKPAGGATSDASLVRMARRVAALRRRVAAMDGDAGERLMSALALVAQALRNGDAETADDALSKIEPAVKRAEAAALGARA